MKLTEQLATAEQEAKMLQASVASGSATVSKGLKFVEGIQHVNADTPTGSVADLVSWVRTQQELALFRGDFEVPSLNGLDGVDGWDMMQELRMDSEASSKKEAKAQFVVVKNNRLKVKVIGVGTYKTFDLVRKYKRGNIVRYWFEQLMENQTVQSRKCMGGVEVIAFVLEEESKMNVCSVQGASDSLMTLIFPCRQEDEAALAEELKVAQGVVVEGMVMCVSVPKHSGHKRFTIVQRYECVQESYDGADNVLGRLSDWRQLTPMRHVNTGEPLFEDIVNLAIIVSSMFTRKGLAALNTILFGKSGSGKTSVAKFWIVNVLGGSFESSTGSSGKGWLISHKEGAPPSKLFEEKTALLIDEMLKAATLSTTDQHHGYVVLLKNMMQRHMQILDHDEVSASSGNARISGRMVCSCIGTENPDEHLSNALGKVSCIAEAALKRIQMAIADRPNTKDDENVNKEQAMKIQRLRFCKQFGGNAMRDIRALILFSRRFTEDYGFEPPAGWKVKVRGKLLTDLKMPMMEHVGLGYPNWFGSQEVVSFPELSRALEEYCDGQLRMMDDAMTAVYVSTAIIRGWEKYNSIKDLQPVIDERQQEMAEGLIEYFFQSRLKVMESGIKEYMIEKVSGGGIQRTRFGGM